VPTYKFTISMPTTDTLPRNRISNTVYFDHVNVMQGTDLESICDDLVGVWSARYGGAAHEVKCSCYDTDAPPNYPRAESIVNAGSPWPHTSPGEVALCLSFCGENGPRPRERGRIYLMPGLDPVNSITQLRPTTATQNWALAWATTSNASLPDIGGIDWKHGIWSPTTKTFHQAKHYWVDDEWDTQRRRGLKASSRVEVAREG